jgi:4'-phosphopantetheinyl transferase
LGIDRAQEKPPLKTPDELRARIIAALRPLLTRTIQVWRTPLSTLSPLAGDLRTLLSSDERDRADKFRFPEHRNAFIAGRAWLRMILGAYCKCLPENLCFTYGAQGKPAIDQAASRASRTVSFNVSHSAKSLQIALAAEGSLGIDVEDLSREFDLDGLVAECLTDVEAQGLSRLSFAQRRNAFLRYWVHKEAFLKCIGTGFSVSPKEVHVTFNDSGHSEMRCSNPLADAVLFGRSLEAEPGHLAALAAGDSEYTLQSISL